MSQVVSIIEHVGVEYISFRDKHDILYYSCFV
jgi:hypothetical protein